MAHKQMRFDLLQGLQSDSDNDDQRGPAKIELDIGGSHQNQRHHSDERKERGPWESNPGHDPVYVLGSLAARPDAGDKTTGFSHIIGVIYGIDHNGRVEIRKKDDHQPEDKDVQQAAGGEPAPPPSA